MRFAVARQGKRRSYQGKRVLLIDDIYTTGCDDQTNCCSRDPSGMSVPAAVDSFLTLAIMDGKPTDAIRIFETTTSMQ